MKLLKKLAAAAALSFAFAGGAQATEVLNNWVLNPSGTGGAAAGETIKQYLDLNGLAFIQITPTTGNAFTFKENGTFVSFLHDGSMGYAGGAVMTATFEATGSGVLGVAGAGNGSFTFSSGTIKLYANANGASYGSTAGINGANVGTLIGTFTVLPGGGGVVDASGNPVSSGNVTVNALASAPGGLKAGTFFTAGGFDLSAIDILSYALTGATSATNVRGTAATEIACEFAGYTANGCGNDYRDSATAFFVSNSGSFKLNDVPEPGSLALFGIAMLGAGFASRKRASKV